MAAQRFAGIAFLKVSGRQYPLHGNFTVSPSPMERAGVAGQDYVHGYSENPRVPFIEGDVSLTQDVSVDILDGMTGDDTITAELANGKTYILTQAWTKSAQELNTKEGTTRVRWEGLTCREIN